MFFMVSRFYERVSAFMCVCVGGGRVHACVRARECGVCVGARICVCTSYFTS